MFCVLISTFLWMYTCAINQTMMYVHYFLDGWRESSMGYFQKTKNHAWEKGLKTIVQEELWGKTS